MLKSLRQRARKLEREAQKRHQHEYEPLVAVERVSGFWDVNGLGRLTEKELDELPNDPIIKISVCGSIIVERNENND